MKRFVCLRRFFGLFGAGIALAAQARGALPISAPPGFENRSGPWSDPADLTVWPNQESHANSDAWLGAHHDSIRRMNPRVLLVNFSNQHSTNHLLQLANQLISILAESSRYHGYRDDKAPTFLNYQVFNFVDLRDADRKVGNSRKIPVKDPAARKGFNMKYADYFSDAFAVNFGVRNPKDTNRWLRLDELVELGMVHELWFFESGDTQADVHVGSFEVVELKPVYGGQFQRMGERYTQAGNGGDPDQPWTGRSLRIGCVNASRGPGCFIESLSHGMEGNANSKAIPYFTRYFSEYAGFDLKSRFDLPFRDLYALKNVEYPDARTLQARWKDNTLTVTNYFATGGNVHYPPNGRSHYDLANTNAVMSTIEDWRIGSATGGKDKIEPWTNEAFRKYRKMAPDCMGPWLVYWRQNMPGLDNRQKDDEGKPMKNWWPFLFY